MRRVCRRVQSTGGVMTEAPRGGDVKGRPQHAVGCQWAPLGVESDLGMEEGGRVLGRVGGVMKERRMVV